MPKKRPEIPQSLKKYVDGVGSPVTPDDVDTFGRLRDIHDRSHLVRSIVNAWNKQQQQDRELRSQYAFWLIIGLGLQSAIINVLFILMGCGKLSFDPWTSRTFIMAVFTQVASMIFFIVKYLFRPTTDEVLKLASPLGQNTHRDKGKHGN